MRSSVKTANHFEVAAGLTTAHFTPPEEHVTAIVDLGWAVVLHIKDWQINDVELALAWGFLKQSRMAEHLSLLVTDQTQKYIEECETECQWEALLQICDTEFAEMVRICQRHEDDMMFGSLDMETLMDPPSPTVLTRCDTRPGSPLTTQEQADVAFIESQRYQEIRTAREERSGAERSGERRKAAKAKDLARRRVAYLAKKESKTQVAEGQALGVGDLDYLAKLDQQ